jgi:hypothetical protein
MPERGQGWDLLREEVYENAYFLNWILNLLQVKGNVETQAGRCIVNYIVSQIKDN